MTKSCTVCLKPPPARPVEAPWLSSLSRPGHICYGDHTPAREQQLDEADIFDIRNGDHDYFRRIVERHQDMVSRMMWRFTRNPRDHEELVQDTFVEAYTSLHTYKGKAPFTHWLARIATRTGYRFWQRQTRDRERQPLDLDGLNGTLTPGNGEIEPGLAAESLYALLAQLPPRDRLVLTLRYLEDLSVQETAQRTGWSATMVKVQANRARAKLEKLIRGLNR